MTERWRPVVGHEGEYEVSDFGRVRSLDRLATYRRWDAPTCRHISVTRKLRGRMLRPGTMTGGHQSVALGKGNSRLVHHLVLEAFVGPRPPKPFESLHADDTPANNVLENLRWGTRSANLHDAVRNGRKATGERVCNAKLKDADIPVIRRRLKHGASPFRLGRDYGVNESTIRQIESGRTWKNL